MGEMRRHESITFLEILGISAFSAFSKGSVAEAFQTHHDHGFCIRAFKNDTKTMASWNVMVSYNGFIYVSKMQKMQKQAQSKKNEVTVVPALRSFKKLPPKANRITAMVETGFTTSRMKLSLHDYFLTIQRTSARRSVK